MCVCDMWKDRDNLYLSWLTFKFRGRKEKRGACVEIESVKRKSERKERKRRRKKGRRRIQRGKLCARDLR